MTDYELISLNPDEFTEEQARDICIEVLEEALKTEREEKAPEKAVRIIGFLLNLTLFGEAAIEAEGSVPTLLINETNTARLLKKIKKGKNDQSNIICLKEIQAAASKLLITSYAEDANRLESFRVSGQGIIWTCIDNYEKYCEIDPQCKDEKVDQAIESIWKLSKKERTVSSQDVELLLSHSTVKDIMARLEKLPYYLQGEAARDIQTILQTSNSEEEVIKRSEEMFQTIEETDDLL